MKFSLLVFGVAVLLAYQVSVIFGISESKTSLSSLIRNALDKPLQQRRRPLVFQNQVLRRRLAGKHAEMFYRKYPLLHRYRVANTLSRYGSVPPMDPDTVVTFEPTYSCPKMVSKPLHPLQKIYFGSDVEEQEFPFLVAIEIILEITGYCTGSIATRNHVLTAAHCVKWIPYINLYVGHPNRDLARKIKRKSIASTVSHPGNRMVFHDYGVIILKKVIGFEPGKVEPICLFLGDVRYWKIKQDEPAYKTMLIGWGETEYGDTNIAKKLWVSAKTCEHEKIPFVCLPSYICFNKDAKGGICGGDSGGPVIGHEQSLGAWVQIGINGFLLGKPPFPECGSKDSTSFSATFFHFKEPELNAKTGNPWCDFFIRQIPHEVHLVKGNVHPNVFCQNPEKRFDWCEFPAP